MYALYQQILLPTLSALCVMVLSWIMYVASRRLGKPAKGETFKEKLYIVQSIVAAFLLGQIAGHTTVFTSSFPLLYGYLFVLSGIVCLRHLESIGRAWRKNVADTPAVDGQVHDFEVDADLMEEKAYVTLKDLGSPEAAEVQWSAHDVRRSNAKRQYMLFVLLFALAVVSTMNGFIMVSRTSPVSSVACFLVNGAAQSVTVFGAMINAGYHTTEDKRKRIAYWCVFTVSWMCILVCSTIPVLLNVSNAQSIINSPYFSSVYLFATGLLWRLSYYYEKNLYQCRNRKEILLDALVFTLALALSAATGFWL